MRSIPLHSLVLMVGPTSPQKTDLLARKFQPYEVESCEKVAFDMLGNNNRPDMEHLLLEEVYRRVEMKLKLGERVVVEAPYLHYKDRIAAVNIGAKFGASTYYVVTGGYNDHISLKPSNKFHDMKAELLRGDSVTNVIDTDIDDFKAVEKLEYNALREDIVNKGYRGICVIPDVHGMIESLKQAIDWAKARGLFIVFLGDVLDYGPQSIDCVYLAYDLVMRSQAIMTIGNHEKKIERWLDQQRKLVHDPRALKGKTPIRLSEGNKATTMIIQGMLSKERSKFEGRFAALMAHARHHWVIGNALFVHGAAEPEMFDITTMRLHGKFESRALYGEIDQKEPMRADGYPNRIYDWVNRIPDGRTVLVGHDIRSTMKPLCLRGDAGGIVYFMDTGSGKGGRLTTADIVFGNTELNVQNFTAH